MSTNLPTDQRGGRQMTVAERRAHEREVGKREMLAAVEQNRPAIEATLAAYEVTFDAFRTSVMVGLDQIAKSDDDFFNVVPVQTFIREVIRAAHVGLKPDGKQGAIVRFANDCTFMPMVGGFVEVIWKTGLVKDVNYDVVCEGDKFDFEQGDEGWVRHSRELTRPANAKQIGAWCVINLMTGGKLIEIVDQADLERINKVNRSTKGPRSQGWAVEMSKKAPFRRVVKRMPKQERLALLIDLEDRNVILEGDNVAPDAPDTRALFSGKPIRRKARQRAPEPAAEEVRADPDVASYVEDNPDLADHYEDKGNPADQAKNDPQPEDKQEPFALRALITSTKPVREYATDGNGPELWFADISQKMKTLPTDKLGAFWKANKAFVEEAGRNGHADFAMKLIAIARDMGLTETPNHD